VTQAYAGNNTSHFQDLVFAGTGAVSLSGRVSVQGNVAVTGTGAVTGTDTLYVGGSVTTSPGTSLGQPGLEVGGALSLGGAYTVGLTNLLGTGQTIPAGNYVSVAATGGSTTAGGALTLSGDLIVRNSGSLTLAGRTAVAGNVTVSANTLTLGGHTLAVGGYLWTNGGALVMTSALDSALVTGPATFAGADETGKLTAGVLVVSGNFTAPGAPSAAAFVASGTHKTVLAGTQPQTVTQAYAGNNTSHFQDLVFAGTGAVSLSSRVAVQGNLSVTGTGAVTGSDTLYAGGNFTTGTGTTVNLPGVEVGGTFAVHGLYHANVTNFFGTNQVIPAGVSYDTLAVTGPGATTQDTTATVPVVDSGAYIQSGNGSL
jgi:hypothetical protein